MIKFFGYFEMYIEYFKESSIIPVWRNLNRNSKNKI